MNIVEESQEIVPTSHQLDRETVERLTVGRDQILSELSKVIVGQGKVIEQILITLLAGGHCLITGAPGLAKTLLVKSIARIFHLNAADTRHDSSDGIGIL